MDSITQIVLGATVGEVCLGKKLGNRAMLWGAIAGTIPDLDVISTPFLSKLEGLIFHRGISHSFFFAILFAWIMAYIIKRYYDSGAFQNRISRSFAANLSLLVCIAIFIGGGAYILFTGFTIPKTIISLISIFLGSYLIKIVWQDYRHIHNDEVDINISLAQWYNFFFWSLVTHPILDCFTTYGTQLFAPFADTRVSWDNISVVDPIYTVPFGLCLLVASFYKRQDKKRQWWNYAGIIISSFYMMFTFYNKNKVSQVLENTLKKENIQYARYMTGPTIFNNVLWSATVETDSIIYQGLYSLKDKEPFFKLKSYPKNHSLLGDKLNNDYTIEKLKWFSKNYFTVIKRTDGRIQVNDMRFGIVSDAEKIKEDEYIFYFILVPNKQGSFDIMNEVGRPNPDRMKNMFPKLWERIIGI